MGLRSLLRVRFQSGRAIRLFPAEAVAAEVTGKEGLPRALEMHRKAIEVSERVVRDEPQHILHRQKLLVRSHDL